MCVDGFAGLDCSVRLSSISLITSSVLPGPENDPLPRVGHSLVNCPSDRNILYLFGGLTRQHELMNELWRYNLTDRQWKLIDSDSVDQPTPRSHLKYEKFT